MSKTLLLKALSITGLVLLSVGVGSAAGGNSEAELKLALEKTRAVVQSADARAAAAAAVQAQLLAQCEALKAEIQEERRRVGAATLKQALQVRRIHSNLRLLAQAAGYAVQLDDRLAYFHAAAARLKVYRDQIRDDLLLLQALDSVDSSALLRQVAEAADEYQRQCAAPLLSAASGESPRDLESLWNGVVKRP